MPFGALGAGLFSPVLNFLGALFWKKDLPTSFGENIVAKIFQIEKKKKIY